MPIHTSIPIAAVDQEAFHAIDKIATGCAFDIHNEMGRYSVSTRYTTAIRRQTSFSMDEWQPLCSGCETLHDTMRRAIADWGCGLDPALYRDFTTYVLGGESTVVGEVEISSIHGVLGMQKVHLLADGIAFSVTASVHRPQVVLEHHRRLLRHSSLRAIQWVNLNRQTIAFETILP